MEFLLLYGMDLIENFSILIGVPLFITIIALFVILFLYGYDNKEMFTDSECYSSELALFNKLKKVLIVCCALMGALCFIPSKQTLLIMSGIHYAKYNESTNEKLIKINKLIDLELDKKIKELEK